MAKLARPSAMAVPRPDWWQHAVLVLAAFLVLGLPFVWSTGLPEAFRGIKRELALAAWAGLAALGVARNLHGRVWRDPVMLAWGGVLAGALLSAPLSPWPLRVLLDSVPLLLAAVGFVALRQLTERQRRFLAAMVVWAGVLEASVTLLFVVPAWRPASFAKISFSEGRYAWIGTLGNPADVAIVLALPFLLAVARALEARRHRPRYVLAAGLMATVLAGTQTLTVLGAVGVAVVFMLLQRLPRRTGMVMVAGVVIAMLGVATITPIRGRISEALSYLRSGQWQWMGSGRSAGVVAAIGMLAAHPLTGAGFGQFEAESYHYQSEDLLAGRAQALGLTIGFGEAHNELLQHAAETGVVGLLLLGAGVVLAWRWGQRRLDSPVLPARVSLLLTAGLVALVQFPLHQATPAAQWAVLAALALPPLAAPPLPEGRRRLGQLGWMGLVCAVIGVTTWHRVGALVAVQHASNLVEVLRRSSAQSRTSPARVALQNLARAVRWLPHDWRAQNALGNLAMEAGEVDEALHHFGAALALAERPELLFNLAMAEIAAGDPTSGMTHLVRAIKLNPLVIKQIRKPELLEEVRTALAADGYLSRHPWVLEP